MLPVRVVRTLPRKRNRISRAQGGGEGHRPGDAVVLRGVLHPEAQRVEQEGGQGVGSEGAVHHRGLLRGAVQRAHGQQEKGWRGEEVGAKQLSGHREGDRHGCRQVHDQFPSRPQGGDEGYCSRGAAGGGPSVLRVRRQHKPQLGRNVHHRPVCHVLLRLSDPLPSDGERHWRCRRCREGGPRRGPDRALTQALRNDDKSKQNKSRLARGLALFFLRLVVDFFALLLLCFRFAFLLFCSFLGVCLLRGRYIHYSMRRGLPWPVIGPGACVSCTLFVLAFFRACRVVAAAAASAAIFGGWWCWATAFELAMHACIVHHACHLSTARIQCTRFIRYVVTAMAWHGMV